MNAHQFRRSLLLFLGFLAAHQPLANEWTRFRGPNGDGISQAKSIPSQWTNADINWKISLPGEGHSSPVVWNEHIFVTGAESKVPKLTLYCIRAADGQQVWRKDFELTPYALHKFNNFASSTPAVDQDGVYLTWLSRDQYQIVAFSHSGKELWRKDLGEFASQHGSGSSPMIYDGKVVLTKDQDGESFMAALSTKDGALVWQTPLRGERADYGTPCIYPSAEGKPLLVLNSMEDGVIALDPDTGKPAWQLAKVYSLRCVSSPVIASGLIVGSCGSGGGGNYVAAVRPPSAAPGSKPEIAYTIRKSAPYVPTSVALNDLLFLWSDGGIVSCVQASSGSVKWQERVGGNFFASPVCIDGRLFGVSTSGDVIVLAASDTFKELGRYSLGDGTHATPAVSGGRLYVRTLGQLLSIGKPN